MGELLVYGTMGFLFFGFCGISMLVWLMKLRRPTGDPAAVVPGSVRHGRLPGMRKFTDEPAGVVFRGSLGRPISELLVSAIFVVVGVVCVSIALSSGDSSLPAGPDLLTVGLWSIGIFGFMGTTSAWTLIAGGNGIVLLAEGVYLRAPAGWAWVRWDGLRYARVADGLQIFAHTPEHIRLSWHTRLFQQILRNTLGADFTYPVMSLKANPHTVVTHIQHYAVTPAARPALRHPASAGGQ